MLAPRLAAARVDAVVVPDLPLEERDALARALASEHVALAPMVTPLTSPSRLRALTAAARGFVYAVTSTGTTGRASLDPSSVATTDRPRPSVSLGRFPRTSGSPIRPFAAARAPPA